MTKPPAGRQDGTPPVGGLEASDGSGEYTLTRRVPPETATTPRSLRRLTCLSVTHKSHCADLVGHLAPEDPLATAQGIHENDRVTEAVVLSTCNRLEVYVSTRTPERADYETAVTAITDAIELPSDVDQYTGRDVPVHLARVTAGLESAVLGEDEIIGQVSNALAASREEDIAAGVLGRVGNAALRAGRKCRTETAINEGPSDYGSATCRHLAEAFETEPEQLVVVGAGTIVQAVVKAASNRWPAQIDVVNRSPARELATQDGRWWPLEDLGRAVEGSDAVVCATGAPGPVFTTRHAHHCQEGLPVVDLATPPDVATELRDDPHVSVTHLDTLTSVVAEAAERRESAVSEAEEIIANSVERFVEQERENRAEDVIRALHQEAADIRHAEVERAKKRLADGDATSEEVMEDMARSMTSRLLGPATDELRTAARERDETALRAARRLFDLEEGND